MGHNALRIGGTLLRRGCRVDPQCPLCLNDIEMANHLFDECRQTKEVWELARQHNWIPLQTSTIQTAEWLDKVGAFLVTYNKKIIQRISFLLWSIWKMRNAVIFQQKPFNPMKCLIRAKESSAEWRIQTCMSVDDSLQELSFPPIHKIKLTRWHPPTSEMVKINFDGSVQGSLATGGYIIRDW